MKRILSSADFQIGNQPYSIKYVVNLVGSKCVRIFDGQAYTINNNGNTKSKLREINNQLNLGVSENDAYGYPKTTHQLALHIIRAIIYNA